MKQISKFGRRLRELRERAGLTQTELSRYAGVPRPSITRVEDGARPSLTIETLVKIARALGVTLDHLVGESFEGAKDVVPRKVER